MDQISKLYIKTNFVLGESIEVFSWFKILFIENEGAAWGAKIPGEYGKLILTLFRLCAIIGIGYWLYDSARKKGPSILLTAIALIFAGAFWNIIDSVFMVLFLMIVIIILPPFSPKNPYGTLFHGR